MSEYNEVRGLILGIRGYDGDEIPTCWEPDEGQSWYCRHCDWWTPDDPPPPRCPKCGETQ